MALWWVVVEPFLDPVSRTWWGWWLSFGAVAVVVSGGGFVTQVLRPFWHRSTGLDVQLLLSRQLLSALGLLPTAFSGLGVALLVVRGLNQLGRPTMSFDPLVVTVLYTGVLFVVWDLSRYAVHRLMHAVPVLWAFHQVHHSAEVLTPLTFHRVHPVESLLYGIRGALVTGVLSGLFFWASDGTAKEATILGVHAIGFVLNGLLGNLRHSQVPVSLGPLEAFLLSPLQHQIHHQKRGDRSNYGTWLAIWDRLGGSWVRSAGPVDDFGIDGRNHDHDLLSAWFGPIRALWRHSVH